MLKEHQGALGLLIMNNSLLFDYLNASRKQGGKVGLQTGFICKQICSLRGHTLTSPQGKSDIAVIVVSNWQLYFRF